MTENLSEYKDGWYEYGYCKLSKGKKKHALLYYLGDRITDPIKITELECRLKEKAPVP